MADEAKAWSESTPGWRFEAVLKELVHHASNALCTGAGCPIVDKVRAAHNEAVTQAVVATEKRLKEIANNQKEAAERRALAVDGERALMSKQCDEQARLRVAAEKALGEHKCKLPDSIEWALNSGDGVYRP